MIDEQSQRVDTTTHQPAQPSGLALRQYNKLNATLYVCLFVCLSLTSLCHSTTLYVLALMFINGDKVHIDQVPSN